VTSEQDNTQVKTREEIRRQRLAEEEKQQQEPKRRKRIRIRLIPIWLRLLIIAILIALSALAGLIVGYGVIGDGEPYDVLKKSTWQHIVDLVEKE